MDVKQLFGADDFATSDIMKDFPTTLDANLSFESYLNLDGLSNSVYSDHGVSWNMDLGDIDYVDSSFMDEFHCDPKSLGTINSDPFLTDNVDSIPFNTNTTLDPPMFTLPGQGA